MFIVALIAIIAAALASTWFAFRLDERTLPGFFTDSVPGRVLSVILLQPFALAAIAVGLISLPFVALWILLITVGELPEDEKPWADLWETIQWALHEVKEFYGSWITSFVTKGY